MTLAVRPPAAEPAGRPRPMTHDPVFWVAAVGALALAAGIRGPVTAAVLAIALVLYPGVLVVGAVQPRDTCERAVTVVATSLVGWMLIAHAMLTFRWWFPDVAGSLALGVFAALRFAQSDRRPPAERRWLTSRPPIGAVSLSLGLIALWAWSLRSLDVSDIGLLGLAAELPPTWYAAAAVAVAVAAYAATTTRADTTRVIIAVAPLLVMIYGTTAVVTGTIRYPWAYKHVGVVRLLDETGRLHPDVDIYNNFSGFFGLAALVRGATGVDPVSYAAWAQLVGEGFVLLAAGYLVYRVTGSVRVTHLAIVVYLLTNWVAQNYFAAQTLGSFLALVTLGMTYSRFRVDDSAREATDPALLARRRAVVAAVFLGLLMVHPLTPVVVVGAVIVAVAVGWVRDRWLLAALSVVGVMWVGRTFTYLAAKDFDLGFGGSPSDNAAGNTEFSDAPDDALLIGAVTTYFSLAVWMLAAVGGVVAGWARRRIGLLVVLAAIPFAIPLVQSYGGEAIYRVYLYSLPLMAALIAWGIVSTTPMVRRSRLPQPTVLAAGICLALAAGFVVVHYGRERVNQVAGSEVAMEQFVDTTVAGPAILAQFSGSHPAQSTARYPEFQVTDTYTPHIVEMLGPSDLLPPPSALDEVADDLVALTPGTPYVLVGPGMIDEIAVVGTFPVTTTEGAASFLQSNDRFRLVHRIDDTYLFAVTR